MSRRSEAPERTTYRVVLIKALERVRVCRQIWADGIRRDGSQATENRNSDTGQCRELHS
jgi:hypothetical protein